MSSLLNSPAKQSWSATSAELFSFCDFLAAGDFDPVLGLFFSDGEFVLGVGESETGKDKKLVALPFDPPASKRIHFWKTRAKKNFLARHLLFGNLHGEISLQSDAPDEFHSIWGRAKKYIAPANSKFTAAPHDHRAEWNELCSAIGAGIDSKVLEKIVPARFQKLDVAEGAARWTNNFSRLQDSAGKNTHKFIFKQGNEVFFGASPELLFRCKAGHLLVPAIAGTRPQSGNSTEAARELLASEKDLREHRLVTESICQSLVSLGLKPKCPGQPEIIILPHMVHLYTPIEAELSSGASAENIMRKLHPTPAMSGYPGLEALDFLRRKEFWDRGYYSAPLGFVDAGGDGAFIVGIRSALFSPSGVYVFAGAGYVAGSSADGEWQETAMKMRGMIELFKNETN